MIALENAAKEALKVRAETAREKALKALEAANKIKEETLEQLNKQLNEYGKWDFTKIEGTRYYPKDSDVKACKSLESRGHNEAEKIITKNEFGGTRIYDFTNRFDNKIIDYMPGDGIGKAPKIREITLAPGTKDISNVTIFNEDGTYTLCSLWDFNGQKLVINFDELGNVVDNVTFNFKNNVATSYNNDILNEFFSFS